MNEAGSSKVSVLLITGTVGAGKTVLAREVGELLRRSEVASGVIDLDALSHAYAGAVRDRFNADLVVRNLTAIWPNYEARGVDHLVLARYVARASELDAYRQAIPSATLRVCRVTARRRRCRSAYGVVRSAWIASSCWPCRRPSRPRSTIGRLRTSSWRTGPIGPSPIWPGKC